MIVFSITVYAKNKMHDIHIEPLQSMSLKGRGSQTEKLCLSKIEVTLVFVETTVDIYRVYHPCKGLNEPSLRPKPGTIKEDDMFDIDAKPNLKLLFRALWLQLIPTDYKHSISAEVVLHNADYTYQ